MGSTYTRQSTFTDGDTITADLFNTEFDQLVAAFAASSGHSHDGTAGEGGPIGGLITPGITLGDNTIDVTLTFDGGSNDGVLKWMEDEDYFEFSDDILIASTEKLQFRDTAIYINSSADGQLDLVADTEIQIAATTIDINGAADISGNLAVGGNLTVTGTTTFNGGTITLGDAAADNVVFGADVDSSIIPDDDDTYDLGSSSQQWRNLYIDGTAEIDTLSINGTTVTATAAELNIMDGVTATAAELNIIDGDTSATSTTVVDADRVVLNDNGTMVQVAVTDLAAYFDDEITAMPNLVTTAATTVGALNSGSITSGFGTIDTGSSTITTTGLISGGSLDIDNVLINGTTIGHTDDTDLITLANGVVTVAGEVSMTTLDIGGTNVTSTAAELNILDGVTSTAAELNILDGVTSTAAELNILDGKAFLDEDNFASDSATGIASQQSIKAYVDASAGSNIVATGALNSGSITSGFGSIDNGSSTITTTGLISGGSLDIDNVLINGTTIGHTDDTDLITLADGVVTVAGEVSMTTLDIGGTNVTSTAAELNILDGVTSTAAELNILDGVTSTAAELNILDGVTSTAAELNILDGVTSTAAELNILDVSNTTLGDLSEISTVASGDTFLAVDASGGGLKKITRSTIVSGLATSSGLSNVVEDTSPQLGGNLDTNSNNILIDDAHFIGDESGNEQLVFQTTGSAVNHLEITNNASGSNPILAAAGGDTNIGIALTPKGTGEIVIGTGNLNYAGTAITSTGAELNILDGVTSTAAELNILDGVTSTAAELNALDGITAVVGELNALDLGSTAVGTAIASKAMILDSNKDYTGVRNFTLSGELDAGSLDVSGNVDVDGTLETDALSINGTTVTSTAAELNILDGVTTTAAEINLIDGGTARGTTAVADGDGVLINDAGTMRMTSVDTLSTYMSGKSVGGSNIVTTGALNSGSITSGFGTIDTGSSTITTTGLISGGSLDIDNVLINGTTIGHTDDTDLITVADGLVTVAGEVQMTTLDIGGTNVTSTAAELNVLDGITAVVGELNALDIGSTAVGTAVASKAMILDSNKDYTGVRNFTLSGELDAGSLDISGDADIDGTLEADAITIGGVSLAETISDTVGAMVSSNTESGITVAYQDADNTLDFTVGTLNQNTTGSAATLTTARAIAVAGDVTGSANFDGSAGISITTTLATNAIVTANITDGNVTVAKMAANSIDSAQYVDGSIDREHLAADIIDGTKIANDAINSEHYAAGSIDNEHIADNAINSEHYADGSIDRAHLAADIIDGTKIANDAINSEHYAAGSIDAEHLASDSVTEAKMAANSVDSQAYVDGSIDQVHLASAIVNEAKMQISNAPTNGYFLSAQSGNTGGLTWAEAGSSTTTGAVGTYGLLINTESTNYEAGSERASSNFAWANAGGNATSTSGTTLAGTWRCMGYNSGADNDHSVTLWVRIS